MKLPSKTAMTLISIPILILLFFSSNIYGYFRFKHYCSSEGGLRVYEKLERNVGWWAKDKYDAHVVALLSGVGFVRYTDEKDGNTYDIKYIGGDPQDDASFKKIYTENSKKPKYKWSRIKGDFLNEKLIGRSGYEVFDTNNKLVVSFYMFGFTWFDSDKTPLSTNIKEDCFHEVGMSLQDLPRSLKEINSSFK